MDEPIEVHSALSAEEGLQLLQRLGRVEVVISDYRMPGMNGIEFLQQVAAMCPEAVGILLSGFTDMATVQQSLDNEHLFSCLRKPWQAGDLRRVINEAATFARHRNLSSGETAL